MRPLSARRSPEKTLLSANLCLALAGLFLFRPQDLCAQQQQVVLSEQEKQITRQLRGLRQMPDAERAYTTKQLALQIRQLPLTANKAGLATNLANLSTEGDVGHDTLQEVAATLAGALHEQPVPANRCRPAIAYVILADLVRYEHVQASLDDPQYAAAMSNIEAAERRRQEDDFTLADLQGRSWTLKGLRGKVVLVNFWATWCGPCRKEMPDLDALYNRFKDQGLVVLAISSGDEDVRRVSAFVVERSLTFPILLDPGRKVSELFQIEGIPKSFVYDRDGKLVSQAIDMRTEKQFLEMLGQAGLR